MSYKNCFYVSSLLISFNAQECSQKKPVNKAPLLPKNIELALRCGNRTKVQAFLNENQNNAQALSGNGTLLSIAVFYNDPDIIKDILDKKPDINCANSTGMNPLHIAAFFGKEEAVQLLTENNADTQKKTLEGETALTLAEKRCNSLTVNTEYQNIIRILSSKSSSIKS